MKHDLTVLEAKRFGCQSCTPDTPLGEAVKQMVDQDISCLVVVNPNGYLTGIITRNDVLLGCLTHTDWEQQPVNACMSSEVITVLPEDTLNTVAQLLVEHHIHRVVVVREENSQQKPVAVVSAADLLYHLRKEME